MATIDAGAETDECATQTVAVGRQRQRTVRRPRLDLLHRAPVLAIAPAMNIPLGILGPPTFTVALVHRLRHSRRRYGVAGGPRSGACAVGRCVGTWIAAA